MNRLTKFSASAGAVTRREFAHRAGLGIAGFALARRGHPAQEAPHSQLALARNPERRLAIGAALNLLGRIDFGGRDLYLKANFNSPDPFPATTHPDTLSAVVGFLRERNCGRITLVERSGMGSTLDIWDKLGVPGLAQQLDLNLVALDDLPAEQWRKEDLPGSNWKAGIEVPKFLDRDTYLVQICNLKTHRFGGVFSASLKNSIGLVAKFGRLNAGYNYMRELHSSSQQGAMIAEVNLAYEPKLIIMDAMQVFASGGPEAGELAMPEVVLASADRVAIDAAGVALLRLQREGPEQQLNRRAVYEQDQLKRAAELDLGAKSADEMRFLTADARGAMLASQLEGIIQELPKPKK
ncbi:MAG: DUF362 domain-containing protein [Acidobacteriia bacterium]|nr:DUF362 domain-containing protein [Terriglobia bacterium]